ncbi:KaiC/GvpD/RAD55 family RecA-like ATPase [Hymenobacter sp. UYAg731]
MDINKLRAATAIARAAKTAAQPQPKVIQATIGRPASQRIRQAAPNDALSWCLTYFSHGPCPSDNRNTWLATLAEFCNERGVFEADLLNWAQGHSPLQGHGEKRIQTTIKGIYRRKTAQHNAKPYRPPAEGWIQPSSKPVHAADVAAESPVTRIRTAAQCLLDAQNAPPLVPLFGCLWETPGIAILVGDTGVGKSVLAVHIAHIITSDQTELLGFQCQEKRRLLYYDFELTDRQFEKRFADFPFSADFLRGDTNPDAEDVAAFTFAHITADLDRTGAQVIILDNITALALKTTADADISIGIMRGLKRLQLDRGISSLVLAHTPKLFPGVALSLNQLAGSKNLSNFADSVFFIGRSVQSATTRYLKQVKNRTDEELRGVLVCELGTAAGYLGFETVGVDEEANHLAVANEEAGVSSRKAPLAEVIAKLPSLLVTPQSANQLENQLAKQFLTDARTIRKRLAELTAPSADYVLDGAGVLCKLIKRQTGREVLFSLQPVPSS